MWGSSTAIICQQIQREMKEFKMIEIKCDKCKEICQPAIEMEPDIITLGEQELYHLCLSCWRLFLDWCERKK